MIIKNNTIIDEVDFDIIPINPDWNKSDSKELRMHRIHWYPAKFPPFIVSKAINFAKEHYSLKINTIADIFCGCGTTALESKLSDLDFWGCDINPVATLIAKVKSKDYESAQLQEYFQEIKAKFFINDLETPKEYLENERINYWFDESQIKELYKLLTLIREEVTSQKYQDFFLCAFSNILRKISRWLIKSIKPQVDPNKPTYNVIEEFEKQFKIMLKAVFELEGYSCNKQIKIETKNFLEYKFKSPLVDMVVTSPPYVTSYEYADLHQLSTLWLNYVQDYRDLRQGTIGSLHHNRLSEEELDSLNSIGQKICHEMIKRDKAKIKSIAKYFFDINKSIQHTYNMLHNNGMAIFLIGNTRYRDVYIDNAKYLTQCMLDAKFEEIHIFKRLIGSKILTRFRDAKGRFSASSNSRKVYNYEYVVIGVKK